MKDNNAYLKQGKWKADRVYKILTNSIYIGIFEYGKYKRKPQDVLILIAKVTVITIIQIKLRIN